ncbi:Panacea domain-containing protein [Veillonella sp. 3310]|uniref:Panacea domain-containing protein n=1 Tax=Veillonella sp. 3310 TaxID=2490956 RepID=UPI000FD6AADE|nr:type II toxin-antitoxin system antitoxin SocA domain-containing protein [Veillonella sp. 3310]
MEKVLDVAKYIINRYEEVAGVTIDELKLHKLLYFVQREAIAITGNPMFKEDLEGWKYGPVSPVVRNYFTDDGLSFIDEKEIQEENKYIVNNIIHQYGGFESWKLSDLSHQEYSWKQARIGVAPLENGNHIIKIEDICKDAQKIRPYDSVYDMYYDEFEDAEGM